MNFLEAKVVPTSEEGIFYNPSFDHDKVFPEVVERQKALAKELDRIDPSRERRGKKAFKKLLKEVDVKFLEVGVTQRERAKRLLEHAFCHEDGTSYKDAELNDYVVVKTNDLYDVMMREIATAGKKSLKAITDDLKST